jgi:hypothetical protein
MPEQRTVLFFKYQLQIQGPILPLYRRGKRYMLLLSLPFFEEALK